MKTLLIFIAISIVLCSCDALDQSNTGKAHSLVNNYMKGHFSSDSYEKESSFGPDSVFISLDSLAVGEALRSLSQESYEDYIKNIKIRKFSGYKLDYSFKQKNADGELVPHSWTFYFNKPLTSIHHISKD
ncbi:hypothetical protein [Mucilaginibacter sp. PAMB04168]|uniref:hypothetical protein n=1 Tax=Mucilaginibacter sp. PAMB04168 TaxID=3138567 RepID=UPI0031F5FA49